jgi:hypothetical protein
MDARVLSLNVQAGLECKVGQVSSNWVMPLRPDQSFLLAALIHERSAIPATTGGWQEPVAVARGVFFTRRMLNVGSALERRNWTAGA